MCADAATELAGGYATKLERVAIAGVEDLLIRSLLDRQQFSDPEGDAERLGISSAAWPLFGVLWPSAILLAERLVDRAVTPTERILEIGCGLGLFFDNRPKASGKARQAPLIRERPVRWMVKIEDFSRCGRLS